LRVLVKASVSLAFLLVLPLCAAAQAQIPERPQLPGVTDAMAARLSSERAGTVEPGRYSAGEGRDFTITPYRGKFLLRFDGAPENFVLTAEPAAMGGKLLKYDTGAAAVSVSVWGGVTLYMSDAPNGLPATHQGDASLPIPTAVSAGELRSALSDEAAHFSYSGNLSLHFAIDSALTTNPEIRALAFDALANVQQGIERLIASDQGRRAVSRRISTVKLERGARPGLSLSGRSLIVRFTPSEGYLGRPSSHAVAAHLGKLLAVSSE
jgi:hypothetical protein